MTSAARTPAQAEAAEFRLEAHNAHLIRRAHQRATTMFQKMMGDSGLTPTQIAVLGTLDRCPDISQNELGGLAAIDTATLSSMLRRLSAQGLIERVASTEDQRKQLVRLTQRGREVTRPLLPLSMQLSAALLDPIPPDERARFVELLGLIGRDDP